MWMKECDHFGIVHYIFLFYSILFYSILFYSILFYYWLILYRKRKNQIYFYFIYDFTTDY
ncbi:hypothetical protein GCZ88_06110 [Escherichia coli]|nr:hypothetical protein [Escherichia coli]EFM9482630.1 hypothetical protein [Escherichia coli]EFN9625097.1 hypothetical protein [Escherichia coli]